MGVRDITSIFQRAEKRKRIRGVTPFPSAFIKQPFWKPPVPTHFIVHILARAQLATPSCREAGEHPFFSWAQITLKFSYGEGEGWTFDDSLKAMSSNLTSFYKCSSDENTDKCFLFLLSARVF